MAKKQGDIKEIFKGDKDGSPVNGPSTSGMNQGAGAVTRLKETADQSRSNLSDNPGSGPYGGGGNYGKTLQDDKGDAALYDEPSNNGGNDEHQESAKDQDVGDYYAELSKRRAPNYDKNANLQTKQAPHDLPPADGGDGFIGANTGPAVNFSYIAGKKGFSEDKGIWDIESSFSRAYPDNSGSTMHATASQGDPQIVPGIQDSRDEFAPWKYTQGDEGFPQTYYTNTPNGGTPPMNDEPESGIFPNGEDSNQGHPDTQGYPGDTASGNRDFKELPVTEFTHQTGDGGGAPQFKFAGVDEGEKVYGIKKSRSLGDLPTNKSSTETNA